MTVGELTLNPEKVTHNVALAYCFTSYTQCSNLIPSQRRSCIYAVTPWRAHRQVRKKETKLNKKIYCYF